MLSFKLPDEFVAGYAANPVWWGFPDVAGNSLGELAFIRSYSRKKDDGSKERWHEVCRRVVEGMYHEQKKWTADHKLPWNEQKAQASAKEAFTLMFDRKWAPPGRGLWAMGTPLVHDLGMAAALQNCAFVSTQDMTKRDPSAPMRWLMEASMLGVGVGFDTLGADKGFDVEVPEGSEIEHIIISDDREGWVKSIGSLLDSYLIRGRRPVAFDYSRVRKAGAPINTFGGTAAGPAPLIKLHETLVILLTSHAGSKVTSRLIVDVMNMIGKCVVSGNVRRSAEIAIGRHDDKDFLDLKDYEKNPDRNGVDGWGWASNNSVFAEVGMDYKHVVDRIIGNGEPGLIWMDVTRSHGRLVDPPNDLDRRAMGYNPCGEQPLESKEMCTLVNLYPTNCANIEEFKRACKYAFLYAKTVTLIPTHWQETNAIMQRNRRIGASFNGAWMFVEQRGYGELDKWADEGFDAINYYDKQYSEWLCVRESNRHTTLKPDGTGGLLAGSTPGAHASPGADYYLRRIRYGSDDPIVPVLERAGYVLEPAYGNEDTTVVAAFPIAAPTGVRSEKEASIYEKAALAARLQKLWSDNSVSFTLSFDRETESHAVEHVLRMFEGQFKTLSFLPMGTDSYQQMPYEQITHQEYDDYQGQLKKLDLRAMYGKRAADAETEKFCTNDVCEIKFT
jgi:ribonucleoside-triphosphate reductase